MRHPFTSIPAGRGAQIFFPLFVATLALMILLNVVDVPLRTSAAPQGIVSLELAGSGAAAQTMLDSWDAPARTIAGFGLGLDYLFMPVYSTTIAFVCVWAAGILGARIPSLASAGLALAWGQWLAALMDAVENAALMFVLTGSPGAAWPVIAWWCAAIKFALIVAGLIYTIVAAVLRLAGARGEVKT